MSHQTWVHLGVRRLVPLLARMGVSPNQLTAARLVTGLGAAAFYALDPVHGRSWGSLLLVVSFLLDRLDGELARATGQSSEWGHTFDLVCDALVNASVFLGIGIGVRTVLPGAWGAALGLVAAGAVLYVLALVVRIERVRGQRAAEVRGLSRIDPDDAMLVVPVAMVLGGDLPLLVAAATLAPLAAIALRWHFRALLREARRPGRG